MKTASKITALVLLSSLLFFKVQAQEVALLTPSASVAEKALNGNPAAPVANAEMTITLKNGAERPVLYFAGPKEEVRKPKVETIGGLGKHTLYVMANDVVCLLNSESKPVACANVKPGTTSVEINISATNIFSK